MRGVPQIGLCFTLPVLWRITAGWTRARSSLFGWGKAAREPGHDEGAPPAAHPGEGADVTSWIARELAGCRFWDRRLGQRLRKLLTHMAGAIGGSIPLACQDWANTKAAYRFLSNPKVSEHEILQGHFQATRTRFPAVGGPILVLQDTTELSYERAQ